MYNLSIGGVWDVVPASIGLSVTDQTRHCEQWFHLKFAGRKQRRDASPADSQSWQKIVLHTGAVCLAASELVLTLGIVWGTCAVPFFFLFQLFWRTDQLLDQPSVGEVFARFLFLVYVFGSASSVPCICFWFGLFFVIR